MIADEQFFRDLKKYEHDLINKIAKERGISEENLERRKEIRSILRKKRRERLRKINEEILRLEREAMQDTPYDPVRSYLADEIGRLISPDLQDQNDESSESEVERYVPSKKPKKPTGSPTSSSTVSKILSTTDQSKTGPSKPQVKPKKEGGKSLKDTSDNDPRKQKSNSSGDNDSRHKINKDSPATADKKSRQESHEDTDNNDKKDDTLRNKQKQRTDNTTKTFDDRKWRNEDLDDISKIFNKTQQSDISKQQLSFDDDDQPVDHADGHRRPKPDDHSLDDKRIFIQDEQSLSMHDNQYQSGPGHPHNSDKKNNKKKPIEYYDMKPIEFSPDNKYKLVFQTVRLNSQRGSSESKKSSDQTTSKKKQRNTTKNNDEQTEIDRLIDHFTDRLDGRAPKANKSTTNAASNSINKPTTNNHPKNPSQTPANKKPATNSNKDTTPNKQERENVKPFTPTKPKPSKTSFNHLASNSDLFTKHEQSKKKINHRDSSQASGDPGKPANIHLSPTDRKPSPSRNEIMELILKYYK